MFVSKFITEKPSQLPTGGGAHRNGSSDKSQDLTVLALASSWLVKEAEPRGYCQILEGEREALGVSVDIYLGTGSHCVDRLACAHRVPPASASSTRGHLLCSQTVTEEASFISSLRSFAVC